ncbi:YcdB/YcdC domain-containing protein [Desulfosporosinus lacus]|uniref:S-layer homology domain-containing protein n=1 Tax=Desulfosporosinus lacus DSM 15449 TaxID=1121420 RepID=A0A1M5S435_9FIRM|nr:YcdB/YcdC domain-containing protein [Desulfosporosinus lacus]SHH33048.1 S-layer homology domain-containing protein [Desulfosporosinus lacus DSM 15449]
MLRKIRHLNIVVVCMLFLQLLVYPVNTLGSEKSVITVEQAVQTVKDNFSIPENYTQLSTGYNEYNDRATYSLNWHAVEQPGGSFNAEVDAISGEILNISQWNEQLKPSFKLPVLSSEDTLKIATDLVAKLVSKHQSEMQLVTDKQQVFLLNNSQPFTYNFRWIRIVNGVPFPENGVNVSVSGEDGRVINYNYNWTEDLVFPVASNIVSPEKARQVFTDTPMLELQYFLPPVMNPQTKEPQRILLVYQLTNKYYGGAVDALTGKPVTLDKPALAYKSSSSAGSISESVAVSTASAASKILSTEAASEVSEPSTSQDKEESSPQISQSEAIEIVKKMVTIPKDFVLRNSSLNPDWQNPTEQVWELQWNTESSDTEEQRYLSARVNAKTGDLIGFNRSYGSNQDDKSKPLNRKEAQKIADNFLKSTQPERFELVKVEAEDFYGGKMPPNIQIFNYVRVVNGIPVSRNGMYLLVDTVAKQVVNYEMNWNNQEFPSSSNALSLNEITERFLKISPLALRYSLIFYPNGQPEIRLAYQPKLDYDMYVPAILDAKTGDPMDWYGRPQSQWSRAITYQDIQGNYAEKEIGIMGLTGAFGEYGENFRPDEKITAGSLLRAMLTAEGNYRDRVLSDEEVLDIAEDRGWLPEGVKLESELSREDLSKIMIRLINMEPSAKVKGIYSVPFTDADTINQDSLGYIALAWGLGILKVDENTLHPDQVATRAEAAYALVHAYTVERPVINYMK